ncbi:glycosyltransferase family 2 protein [Parapedobacter koreensis]|uniref:Glycosyltransferase involved in cell wall bisynthesis n=1 Tax=Parapedobacter koreensis TaxID=332977 RepID=A0A1H7GHS8_9SPHI|nr:glycosyltransferase family A protein [Parapedobacter koreensis]SEK36030.1 Glycosyltransferase involved in cell wall bisynthesis [Parapedobacter koreensis]
MTPLVSVVIPFYNMQEFLAQTIDWTLELAYPTLEIILVDDGSTDDSGAIAKRYAERFEQVSFLKQANQGVSVARNFGISYAGGTYILPLDGDDRICPRFIEEAVSILESRPEVKVVTAEGEFFGDKAGLRRLPEFNINLLARKNILHVSALYRKSDWREAGGYCAEMKGREDWDFWIAMLKNGGEVVKLPMVGYHYRIRPNSKRIQDRKLKKQVNDLLNARHREFFRRVLGGPLRINRSWSRPYNKVLAFLGLLR